MRLDRYLASTTDLSRSLARRVVRAGEVQINGITATDHTQHIATDSCVEWNGELLVFQLQRYFMLHKPASVVSVTRDSEHPTVIDLLNEHHAQDLHPVGRLDLDTTGLLLLTDDGQWSHRLSSPRSGCEKTYRVTLAAPHNDLFLEQLRGDIMLKNETTPVHASRVMPAGTHEVNIGITEGRYHQVKRMVAACGNHVTALHRESIGDLMLDPALAPGQYRPLTAAEIVLCEAKAKA